MGFIYKQLPVPGMMFKIRSPKTQKKLTCDQTNKNYIINNCNKFQYIHDNFQNELKRNKISMCHIFDRVYNCVLLKWRQSYDVPVQVNQGRQQVFTYLVIN